MFKRSCYTLLFFCWFIPLQGISAVKTDSLKKILVVKDRNLRRQKLVVYLSGFFNEVPVNEFNSIKKEVDELFVQYQVTTKPAFDYFIESIYQRRLSHDDEAETEMFNAVRWAQKTGNHYLVYAFFTQLGFLQTFFGNTTGAVSSFRMAKKEAILLNDSKLQVLIDINISDLYYRNNFYTQSLFYLKQADSILDATDLNEQRLNNAVTFNKAENYFRMGDLNKLMEIDQQLNGQSDDGNGLYNYKKRTAYYILLLGQDYKNAINQIQLLRKDKAYAYDATDDKNLADAYYQEGKLDSAKAVVNRLLGSKQQENHPEVNFHLYAVLAEIAQKQNDYKQAALNFKLAFQESEKNINRLTSVGYISTEMKADELEGFFVKKESGYKKERVWLIVSAVIALLSLVIGAMLYRNIKQKRYYEKLLFATQKEELAFINSHEVRRHLSNILGLIDTINHSEEKDEAYRQAEQHLLSAAESLDAAIRNISDKLE